jgi:hypothetical protein
MGQWFNQQQPTTGTEAPAQAGGVTAPQGGGFGQGLTNLLSNPLLGTALTGYFGAIGAPRLSGMGGALSRGGLMAMSNLPNLIKAQQEQQLLPIQVAQAQLGLKSAQEKEAAMGRLPTNMADIAKMSPRDLAEIDPGMIAPLMTMSIGKQANSQGAAVLEAMAQDPKYAGTQTAGLLHTYSGMLGAAPQYVPFNDLMNAVLKGQVDQADILLKGAQTTAELKKPELMEAQIGAEHARSVEELSAANKSDVEAKYTPQEVRIKQQQADASTSRANAEWAKVPVALQKQIDTVTNTWTKANLMPGKISWPGKQEQYQNAMYQDLINHGATPDIAASKVRTVNPYFTVPTGAGADEAEPGPIGATTAPAPPSAPAAGTPAATPAPTVGGKAAPTTPTVGGMDANEFLKKYGVTS